MPNKLIQKLFLILFTSIFITTCSSTVEDETLSNPIDQPIDTPTAIPTPTKPPQEFDGQRAYHDVVYQVDLGPRTPGSQAHSRVVEWIEASLRSAAWAVNIQETEFAGIPVRNVIGKYGNGNPWIIIGAHYDSRMIADREPNPELRATPVPGANDGASGVAVLLELARIIPEHIDGDVGQVWLVFFDAEDNGRIPEWDWIIGSQAFVEELAEYPDAAVIVDMVGDADLNIYLEKNSDPQLSEDIWKHAHSLGYESNFIPQYKYKILDDHIPFLRAGIPAVDLIDFDYPYWHTLEDTADKVSAESLKIVGDTVLVWLKAYFGISN
jgi:Zn-dependent M28 family amino/carboxypeptidase